MIFSVLSGSKIVLSIDFDYFSCKSHPQRRIGKDEIDLEIKKIFAGIRRYSIELTALNLVRSIPVYAYLDQTEYIMSRLILELDKCIKVSSSVAFAEKTIWQITKDDFLKHRIKILSQRGGRTNIVYVFEENPNIIVKVLRHHATRMDAYSGEIRFAEVGVDIVPGLEIAQKLGEKAVAT